MEIGISASSGMTMISLLGEMKAKLAESGTRSQPSRMASACAGSGGKPRLRELTKPDRHADCKREHHGPEHENDALMAPWNGRMRAGVSSLQA